MLLRRTIQFVPRSLSSGLVARPVVYRQSYAAFCTATEDHGEEFRKKLQADLIASMKSGDKDKVSAVRLIKSKITNKDKVTGSDISTEKINQVLFDMLTTAAETEQEMKTHNRDDLAQKERALIDTINTYLPKQLTREEVKAEAEKVIKDLNATSIRDMGKVVEALTKNLQGRAQPKAIGEAAKELLSPKKN